MHIHMLHVLQYVCASNIDNILFCSAVAIDRVTQSEAVKKPAGKLGLYGLAVGLSVLKKAPAKFVWVQKYSSS